MCPADPKMIRSRARMGTANAPLFPRVVSCFLYSSRAPDDDPTRERRLAALAAHVDPQLRRSLGRMKGPRLKSCTMIITEPNDFKGDRLAVCVK